MTTRTKDIERNAQQWAKESGNDPLPVEVGALQALVADRDREILRLKAEIARLKKGE